METDRRRFERVYDDCYDAIFRYCLRRTNREDALDAAAETFLVAWRRRADVPIGRELPWLYGVAGRVLANQWRGRVRHEAALANLRAVDGPDDGPWPLIVVIPPQMGVDYAARAMAQRGAVTVVAESWTIDGWSDPAAYLYPEMDRVACVVGWAQAHAADYGASAESTTVDGYSGGAMPATWVGLGLADDTPCPHQISELPTGLVVGESQPLFHHQRWDPSFASGDPEPRAVLDGFFNPQNWNVSADLRVALWSAQHPLGETRSVENPPGDDSWLWLREAATPFVEDFIALGALDDERVDWADNARLMEYRMQQAGVDVQNVTYDIGHLNTEQVYDLIFSIRH